MKGTMRIKSACHSSSNSQKWWKQKDWWSRREQDWETSPVHQWTNAVVQCVLYLSAVSWAMSCWSLLFQTQVPFSSSAVLWHSCVIPNFPVGVPWIFLFRFKSLIKLLCNFRWASSSCNSSILHIVIWGVWAFSLQAWNSKTKISPLAVWNTSNWREDFKFVDFQCLKNSFPFVNHR